MTAQLARWGNCLAVRLPRPVAEAAGLSEGATVELEVADGVIRIVPKRPSYTLAELLAGITPENLPESFDDGPHGREQL